MTDPIQVNDERISRLLAVMAPNDYKSTTFSTTGTYIEQSTITINSFGKMRHVHMDVKFTEAGVTRRDNLTGGFANYICGADTIKTAKKHTGVLTAFDNDPVHVLTAQTNANGILLVVPSSAKPITTYDYIGDIFWIDNDDTDEITFAE